MRASAATQKPPLQSTNRPTLLGGEPSWLFRIAPREVAAGVTTSFQKEEEDPGGDTFVAEERRELEVYHLAEESPANVLSFTAFEAKRNVECDVIKQVEYGPVEGKLTEGFHPFRVASVSTDYCAQTYGGPPDEGESGRERGVTREEVESAASRFPLQLPAGSSSSG